MKETDLYFPVKKLFEGLGFEVHGEVHDIDVIAIKEDHMVLIELKTSFNLKLVLQAITRQKMATQVYVAIPRPNYKQSRSKAFQEKELLLKRLELGLILVALDIKQPYAQIAFDPKPYSLEKSQARSKKRKEKALKEVSERHGDYNLGGTKGKLVTAYREKALLIVFHLKENDEMTLKNLRIVTGNVKVQSILYSNYYGWFERVKIGVYRLSQTGIEAYEEYKHIINQIT